MTELRVLMNDYLYRVEASDRGIRPKRRILEWPESTSRSLRI